MDPKATLARLLDALSEVNYQEAAAAAGDLAVWLDDGGFPPTLTAEQQKLLWDEVAQMAAQLHQAQKA